MISCVCPTCPGNDKCWNFHCPAAIKELRKAKEFDEYTLPDPEFEKHLARGRQLLADKKAKEKADFERLQAKSAQDAQRNTKTLSSPTQTQATPTPTSQVIKEMSKLGLDESTYAIKASVHTQVTYMLNTGYLSSLGSVGRRRLFQRIKKCFAKGSWDDIDIRNVFHKFEYPTFEPFNPHEMDKLATLQYLVVGVSAKIGSWKSLLDGQFDPELMDQNVEPGRPRMFNTKTRKFYKTLIQGEHPALTCF
jgi:hypothetical protein